MQEFPPQQNNYIPQEILDKGINHIQNYVDSSKEDLWAQIPVHQLDLAAQLSQLGFKLHHCTKTHLTMYKGFSNHPYANHVVGGATAIIKDDQILLIQEKSGYTKLMWGLPGGHVDNHEFCVDAAVREAKEETGLDVQIQAYLFMIQTTKSQFGKGNLYMVFYATLKDESQNVVTCRTEINDHKWVKLSELTSFIKANKCVGTLRLIDDHIKRNIPIKTELHRTSLLFNRPKL